MLDQTFSSLFLDTGSVMASVTTIEFLMCCAASVVLGIIAALVYTFKHTKYTKNFVVTLALLPLIVQAVITLVNGNLGAGIAVMGVFNLIRFRSVPGTAKDVTSVFLAMAIGLATGMGFIGLAVLFTVVVCIVNVCFALIPFDPTPEPEMELHVTVPDTLEYDKELGALLSRYSKDFKLNSISTTGEGMTQYKLEYEIRMNDAAEAKRMIEELRELNGNLKVSLELVTPRRSL